MLCLWFGEADNLPTSTFCECDLDISYVEPVLTYAGVMLSVIWWLTKYAVFKYVCCLYFGFWIQLCNSLTKHNKAYNKTVYSNVALPPNSPTNKRWTADWVTKHCDKKRFSFVLTVVRARKIFIIKINRNHYVPICHIARYLASYITF